MSPDRGEGKAWWQGEGAGASTVTLTFPSTGNAARMPTPDSRVKGTQCYACWSTSTEIGLQDFFL